MPRGGFQESQASLKVVPRMAGTDRFWDAEAGSKPSTAETMCRTVEKGWAVPNLKLGYVDLQSKAGIQLAFLASSGAQARLIIKRAPKAVQRFFGSYRAARTHQVLRSKN